MYFHIVTSAFYLLQQKMLKLEGYEGMCEIENLFKPIVTNTFISVRESGQLVLPRKDALSEHNGCFP